MNRVLALIVTLSLSLAVSAADRVVAPRVSNPPIIDGKVSSSEWKGATHLALSENEGEALLLHDGNYLYVGIVGLKPGIGSVCVPVRTSVAILHASAALGAAVFDLEEGKWKLTRGFTWTNRDTGQSAEAMADREKMIKTTGWFANTSRTAQATREYQISVRGKREMPLVIGFHTFTPEQQKFSYWPATIEDGCADPDLASGHTDGVFTFDPSKWGVVELKQ
jgi:hypothetical protein